MPTISATLTPPAVVLPVDPPTESSWTVRILVAAALISAPVMLRRF